MSVLLETTVGDIVIDLDLKGSPKLCFNFLKLCKARYYTNTLVYNVQLNRFCQAGDPTGDGSGGASIYGVKDDQTAPYNVKLSTKRFLSSQGHRQLTLLECQERGRVVMTEMNGIPNTVGSQFLITLDQGEGAALDGYNPLGDDNAPKYLSLGQVAEDDDGVLDTIHAAYCDTKGRPYADIRIIRALVLHDPFIDPTGMEELLKRRAVDDNNSPNYERPPEEIVERRIAADQIDVNEEETTEQRKEKLEAQLQKEDKSRAVVLEMLGDLPDAEIAAPEDVLFVCKLNPITQDEDLELIFSRFDQQCKAEIIRDPDTGNSLCYAFIEFSSKKQCVEAYFKMNNALIDDRRIKVDFSQSVAKVWNKFNQRSKVGGSKNMPILDFGNTNHRGPQHRRNLDDPKGPLPRENVYPSRESPYYPEHRNNGQPDYSRQSRDSNREALRKNDGNKRYVDRIRESGSNNFDRDGVLPVRNLHKSDRNEKRREYNDSSDESLEMKSDKKDDQKRFKDDRRHKDGGRKRRYDSEERSVRQVKHRRRQDDQERRHSKDETDDDENNHRRQKHHRHDDRKDRHRKHSKKRHKRSRSDDRRCNSEV